VSTESLDFVNIPFSPKVMFIDTPTKIISITIVIISAIRVIPVCSFHLLISPFFSFSYCILFISNYQVLNTTFFNIFDAF
jgi:hypothetical protein